MQTGASADARAMRLLQQRLGEFIHSDHAPREVQFAAFFVDVMIGDAFKNVFGDQVWSEEAEEARITLCTRFRHFFERIAAAIGDNEERLQFESFKDLVVEYLGEIRHLNEIWRSQQSRRGA